MEKSVRRSLMTVMVSLSLFSMLGGCGKATPPTEPVAPIGAVRVGDMNGPFAGQMPFELLPSEQREAATAGDSICTTYPGLFLDFRYPVVVPTPERGLVCGRFTGWDRQVVTSKGTLNLREFTRESIKEMRKNLEFFEYKD